MTVTAVHYGVRVRSLVLLLCVPACAVTASTCPVGTKLVTTQSPEGRSELCTASETTTQTMPVTGRDFTSTFALAAPVALSGAVDGPYTSWYPNGVVRSHGSYRDLGSHSVPDGVWAFWYPSGQRHVLGTYFRGDPVGCFAVWDEQGNLSTGHAAGTVVTPDGCAPPSDAAMVAVEGQGPREPEPGGLFGDATVAAFAGRVGMGARNAGQVEDDARMTAAFSVTIRKTIGKLRIGPVLGLKMSTDSEYTAYQGGVSVAYSLAHIGKRIETEAALELDAQYTELTAFRRDRPGTAKLSFWSPLPAVELAASIALTPFMQAVVAARLEGTPRRDVARDVTYCDVFACAPPLHETWHVGGMGAGATVGLRLLLR